MNNTEKAVSLFKYIRELYAQRFRVITDVRKQQWHKFVHEIPVDKENIIFNYFDSTDEINEDETESEVILQIKKPEFETCPLIPDLLNEWVENGWDNYMNPVIHMQKLVKYKNNQGIVELFTDDENRIKEYKEWSNRRDSWVIRQRKIAETRNFFNELYFLYVDLERDSESIEFMVGQGILDCEIDASTRAYHPLLLKRVALKFDSKSNILTIIDTNTNPEIYTMLLQEINYINHNCVKELKNQLSENFYHPLDRNDTPDYLKSFAHLLCSDSRYEENFNATSNALNKVVIYNNPVFFVRKRTGGILKALEEIIEQISKTGNVPNPILNLIGGNVSQLAKPLEQLDISQSLAKISGEDKDIIFSKEANKEQLEIAKRIENYNAVLVQGPPGTGKTHTVANLIGHFLTQGKNVLITSQTKKALSVVKEKVVPELQNLCVAVLDDNNKDMERSVDGITEYISSHTSLELSENTERLKKKREQILEDLAEVRKKIYTIKHKEYETISFGGKGYSIAEAADFVYKNKENLSYLPGKVSLYKPLPVSVSDLKLLYQTNDKISIKEEMELDCNLPNPKDLLSPSEFLYLINKKKNYIQILQDMKQSLKEYVSINLSNFTATVYEQPFCINFNVDKAEKLNLALKRNSSEKLSKWEINAVLAGKNGGGFKAVWEKLINLINETYNFSSDIATIIIGKKLSITEKNISEEGIKLLQEIKAHFCAGKKLNGLSFLMHKEWKTLISGIKINDHEIKTSEDCNVAISFITLNIDRNEIRNLWTELIENHGGIAFSEFGDEPEQSCIGFVSKFEYYLNWYNETYEKLKNLFIDCGFCKNCIDISAQYISPFKEIEDLISLMYNIVPQYVNLAKIIYIDLPKITEKLLENSSKVEFYSSKSSICKNILFAIKKEDVDEYKKYYELLDELYKKYFYQSERKRIITAIKEYAPEWAKMVENRVGIHGKSVVPENIEDAWKWKQFAGIIDEITSEPFEDLQHKSVFLNSELRKVTAEFAENSAWFYLLSRLEADIGQKQALQGWKLTTKKIGKGTGKTAPKLKREAQRLMAKCQSAVPVWIMPINKALENLNPSKNKFDVVIIDEASQSDVSALAIVYFARKIIIVGDDEQVSPSAVGIDVDKMANLSDMYIKGIIPNAHLYDMKSSLYDIAKTTFKTLMLKEHFRCVPAIIGYSNRLSYDYKIKPLRDDSNVPVKPATIAYRVNGKRDQKKCNDIEAKTIVSLMISCMQQPEYDGMTFGVISLLGDEQAKTINKLAIEKISPQDYESRKILCGNAYNFQGDERDIIFISLVDSNEGDGPLRMTGEGVGKSTKQRYNVAVSRAKNQLWVVHSLDVDRDLKSGDMRKDLIEYVTNPSDFAQQESKIKSKADSPFEISVTNSLVKRGYHIVQQWLVGSYRIDMVAVCGDKKIAIECDGELYHSGNDKVRADMERQAILERLGWRFIRIRGSEYYSNPDKTMKRVITELMNYEIEPEQNIEISNVQDTELKQRVISCAAHIMDKWQKLDESVI
ncbi:MAG: AAA domain-containing protein [Clostridia bacterium]|nr:AAA domain-containing protein [Clostridia bacterium]